MRMHGPRRRTLAFDSLERRETPSATPVSSHALVPHIAAVQAPTTTHDVIVPLNGRGELFLISNTPVAGQGYSNTLSNLAGSASQIQVFTGQIKGPINSFGAFTSTGTLTLQNGDVLAVAVSGATKKAQGKPTQFTANFFVSGYAGIYDGARGSGTLVGHFNPKLKTAYYTLKGTITLVVPGPAGPTHVAR